jgi:hypothetical protein
MTKCSLLLNLSWRLGGWWCTSFLLSPIKSSVNDFYFVVYNIRLDPVEHTAYFHLHHQLRDPLLYAGIMETPLHSSLVQLISFEGCVGIYMIPIQSLSITPARCVEHQLLRDLLLSSYDMKTLATFFSHDFVWGVCWNLYSYPTVICRSVRPFRWSGDPTRIPHEFWFWRLPINANTTFFLTMNWFNPFGSRLGQPRPYYTVSHLRQATIPPHLHPFVCRFNPSESKRGLLCFSLLSVSTNTFIF